MVAYRCGQKASLALADFLAGRIVEYIDTDERTYKRILGVLLSGWS